MIVMTLLSIVVDAIDQNEIAVSIDRTGVPLSLRGEKSIDSKSRGSAAI
jgi:hypothetical protein